MKDIIKLEFIWILEEESKSRAPPKVKCSKPNHPAAKQIHPKEGPCRSTSTIILQTTI